eukprot:2161848-Alexandrium_andersonii.AAC.1
MGPAAMDKTRARIPPEAAWSRAAQFWAVLPNVAVCVCVNRQRGAARIPPTCRQRLSAARGGPCNQ